MSNLKWLDGYSGQTVAELLSLEGECRIDSLVLAFEQAVDQKGQREGTEALSAEERMVLAIEALEREVNNGGYHQFFVNSSREFVGIIVRALVRINCPKTAEITQRAIDAAMADEKSEEELNEATICTTKLAKILPGNCSLSSKRTKTPSRFEVSSSNTILKRAWPQSVCFRDARKPLFVTRLPRVDQTISHERLTTGI
jgi:hypothetical protein